MVEPRVLHRPLALLLSTALALPTLLTGCGLRGSGVEAVETRQLESFDAIEIDHWLVRPKLDTTIEVWVPSLSKVSVSGAADMRVDGLHGERFELAVSGVSTSKLSGTIDHFEVDSSGANTLDATDLHAKVVKIAVSGAGESNVWASEQLDANISGAGNIRYHGEPKDVQQDVSGAGSIEQASD